MTAFVVFSSMGFYPLPRIAQLQYWLSAIRGGKNILENGKTFTIKAPKCSVKNKYIQSAKLNGQPLNKPWFTHEELMNGALLELQWASCSTKAGARTRQMHRRWVFRNKTRGLGDWGPELHAG